MSGIILIIILAIWFYVVLKLSGLFVSKMKLGKKRSFFRFFLGIIFFLAPVADDIAGGFQFRALCHSKDVLIYDAENAEGRTVQLKDSADRRLNKIIPISEQKWEWVDSSTGEALVIYKDYHAKGGWLSRSIGFPQGSPPYTFNGYCGSKKARLIFDELNITKDVKNYYGE
tara:strand:- start:1550 stop:2062 length:513 start_codon:yes stop_codon:yes gene_type:complete